MAMLEGRVSLLTRVSRVGTEAQLPEAVGVQEVQHAVVLHDTVLLVVAVPHEQALVPWQATADLHLHAVPTLHQGLGVGRLG